MIRKKVFENVGYFNEKYISCFEDVELNFMCLYKGFENYNNSDCVSYHYESQTRNDDNDKLKNLRYDYQNNLLPMAIEKYQKIKSKISII